MMELPEKFKFICTDVDQDNTVYTAEKDGDVYTVCWKEYGGWPRSVNYKEKLANSYLTEGLWKIVSEEPPGPTNAETIAALKARVDYLEETLEGLKKERATGDIHVHYPATVTPGDINKSISGLVDQLKRERRII